jgi:hypothetical protein
MRSSSTEITVTRAFPEEHDVTVEVDYTFSAYGIDYRSQVDGMDFPLTSREQDNLFDSIQEEELGE